MTKARPILFSAPMVRALLDGRKTQTRRIAKVKKEEFLSSEMLEDLEIRGFETMRDDPDGFFVIPPCPYGRRGDLLWVRETWMPRALDLSISRIMKPRYRADSGEERPEWRRLWKPSIHMPRWASRLTLEITGVRVERLNDISQSDAKAEGLTQCESGFWWYEPSTQEGCYYDPRWAYEELWESINGFGSWNENPWVWVLTFKVHRCNVAQLIPQSTS